MAAHFSWRLRCLVAKNSDVLIPEINMRESIGGANVAIAANGVAVGTAGWYSTAEGPDKAFDGNSGTFFQGRSASVGFKFTTARDIKEITVSAHPSYLGRTFGLALVQWSDDSTNGVDGTWTTAWIITPETWSSAGPAVFTDPVALASATPKRFWAVFNGFADGTAGTTWTAGTNYACSELRMMDEDGLVTPSAVVASPVFDSGFTLAAVLDGDLLSNYASDRTAYQWLGLDFGVGNSPDITAILWNPRNSSFAYQMPKTGSVMVSSDGKNWLVEHALQDTEPTEASVAYNAKCFVRPGSTSTSRLYRLFVSERQGGDAGPVSVATLSLRTAIGGAQAASVLGTGMAAVNTPQGGTTEYRGSNAFDSDGATYATTAGLNDSINFYFYAPTILAEYAITPRSGFLNQAPKSWSFQALDESTMTWVSLDTRAGEPAFTTGEVRAYTMSGGGTPGSGRRRQLIVC